MDNIVERLRGLYKSSLANKKQIPPFLLVILDGWGIAPPWGGNAVTSAPTPNFDMLWKEYPRTSLKASGEAVGLPQSAPGNSEAGHFNIGAGRIVHQDVSVIDKKINSPDFENNKVMLDAINNVKINRNSFHLLGLLSETGTHSDINHLYPILKLLKKHNIRNVFIHLFSDGRDSEPMSGLELVDNLSKNINQIGVGKISTITGRYYAMDRDNHWGRTARAYNAMVKGEAEFARSPKEIFASSYRRGVTDEFIEPRIIAEIDSTKGIISDNDTVLIFNFRPDRIRQIVRCFSKNKIKEFPDRKILKDLKLISFTSCGENLCDSKPIFLPNIVKNPLPAYISKMGLKQFHIAETEKYAHVTYFIDGGVEIKNIGEEWELIESPKVRTYDLMPKMSAKKVTDALLKAISKNMYDFYIVNYANPDMVGHTGNLKAVMQAISCVDQQLGRVMKTVSENLGTIIICADHGNAEEMLQATTGEPNTEHTTNPVPLIIFNDKLKKRVKMKSNGKLANIAPTILDILGFDIPVEMGENQSLIENM